MTDFLEFREGVLGLYEGHDPNDPLAACSATGVVALFNKLAPADLHIGHVAPCTLIVSGQGEALTGRDTAVVIEHFSRAIAAVGVEISHPGRKWGALGPADYARAPIYPSGPAGGPLTLSASAGGVMFSGEGVESLAEQSMVRLVNLLPESAADETVADRILSSRLPSARAIHEVALAAKRLRGLTVQLHPRAAADVSATVDLEQAGLIEDLLKDVSEEVTKVRVVGRLDGMRMKRREFYLDTEGGELHGSIDEAQMPLVRKLLDRRVSATIERVTKVTRAGIRRNAAHRLVDIDIAGTGLPFT